MRVRLSAVLLAGGLLAMAADAVTVDDIVKTVRTSLARKRKDAAIADALDKMKLGQHLEDRVIEILESEGAGPETLGMLQHLRDASRLLPAPPDPPAGMTPPPPPSSGEEHRTWQAATAKARDYTHSLPDFVCTETIHRWIDPTRQENWQTFPTIVADLTFFDQQENYEVKTIDGKKSKRSMEDLEGAVSQGEFGSFLATIFNPAESTEYRWDHWTILRKRPTSVYFFRIAAAHRPHELRYKEASAEAVTAFVGLHGYVYVDGESGSVMRLSAIAEEIPPAFPVQSSSAVLDYDFADIGGARYLLPLRAEVRIDSRSMQSLNAVEFQSYRKFRAETSVSFGK